MAPIGADNPQWNLSDNDLDRVCRSILYQIPAAPVAGHRAILGEWVRRRYGRPMGPWEWVELAVARRLVQDMREFDIRNVVDIIAAHGERS
jgi:hypothetical protein